MGSGYPQRPFSNRLPVAADEIEHPAPCVLRGGGELLLLTVEEAVRRTLVDDDLVLDAGGRERCLERGVVLGEDVAVVAGLQRKDRRLDVGRPLGRTEHAVALHGVPVEPDRTFESVAGRSREPGLPAAEAEAECEDRRAVERADVAHGCADVLLYEFRLRLPHMRHVVEVDVTLRDARGTAEIVDRNRDVPPFGEAQRELLIEAVETAHIREDRYARLRHAVREREKGGEPVPVLGGEESGSKHMTGRHYLRQEDRLTRRRCSGMAEQSHREEMSAAIRAQRER